MVIKMTMYTMYKTISYKYYTLIEGKKEEIWSIKAYTKKCKGVLNIKKTREHGNNQEE